MKKDRIARATLIGLLAVSTACATTTTSVQTATVAGDTFRPGRVVSVQNVVHRTEGNPVAGAVVGAVIGGLLFRNRRGGPSYFGMAAGANVGAAASAGRSESYEARVLVQFDDGARQMFVVRDGAPFRPGDAVAQTSRGLEPL